MKTQRISGGTAAVSSRSGQATVTLLWCLLGMLIPRAMLYGEMAPFGISLAAATQSGSVPVIISLIVGYLLAGEVLYPIRYMIAVAVVGGLKWVLAAMPDIRTRPFVAPSLAFVSTIATGLIIYSRIGLDVFQFLLLLAESAVAAGCAVFFDVTVRWSRRMVNRPELTVGQQASIILTGAVLIMAASTVQIQGFAPGRVLGAFLILVLARSGRASGGCMAGVIVGASLALSAPDMGMLALSLAFGGLVSGLFSRFGKPAEVGAFLLAAGVIALSDTGDGALIRIYEMLAAGAVFLLLPKSLDRRWGHLFIRGQDTAAVSGVRRAATMRLQIAAGAMKDVGETVTTVSRRLTQVSAPDVATVLQGSRLTVCAACPMRAVCWEEHERDMRLSLEQLEPLLREKGEIGAGEWMGFVQEQCRQKARLTEDINRRYEQHIVRESAWQRLRELQSSLQQQFGAVSELLGSVAADLESPRTVDAELTGRVTEICRDFGMTVRQTVCYRHVSNRLTVEIMAGTADVIAENGRWMREIENACARTFAPPVVTACGDIMRITLTEQPRYRVEVGVAQQCCAGEKLCGDATAVVTAEGNMVAMLSDGMGSGGRAAVDGAMTVGLSSRLWQAGFAPESILKTVNAALLVKSREESLSTLDVAVIDGFSGALDCYKAGAATSLLRSGTRVSRLEKTSLPIGILPQVSFEHLHDRLVDGDILLLMSDGAFAGGVAAVETLLQEFPPQESMQSLAEQIVSAVVPMQGEHTDDITVMALRLHTAKPS